MKLIDCLFCTHFIGKLAGDNSPSCKAFSGGIPKVILQGKHDHRNPYPNAINPQDNGVRFEPVKVPEK